MCGVCMGYVNGGIKCVGYGDYMCKVCVCVGYVGWDDRDEVLGVTYSMFVWDGMCVLHAYLQVKQRKIASKKIGSVGNKTK